ncbi:UNVERIFIED_CONTAM: hypothetical protein Sindi_1507600 [Sesamum indicum]
MHYIVRWPAVVGFTNIPCSVRIGYARNLKLFEGAEKSPLDVVFFARGFQSEFAVAANLKRVSPRLERPSSEAWSPLWGGSLTVNFSVSLLSTLSLRRKGSWCRGDA